MANTGSAPQISKRNTAVSEQNTAVEQTKAKEYPASAVGIYMAAIDNYPEFIRGEIFSGTLEERSKFQENFLQSVQGMLELDFPQLKEVLDYFIKVIIENRQTFYSSNLLNGLKSLETKYPESTTTMYKRFIYFIILRADNVRDPQRFLTHFDVPTFTSHFSPKVKQNLVNYIYY